MEILLFNAVAPFGSEHTVLYIIKKTSGRIHGRGYLSGYSYSLRAGRSGDPISVRARFSAPFQTGPSPTQPPL